MSLTLSGTVRLSVELSRAQTGNRFIVLARIEADKSPQLTRAPLNVSFVLDRSGSMAGPKLEQCKRAVAYAIGHLLPTDTVSLVTFESGVEVLIPHAAGISKERFLTALAAIQVAGSTNLSGGWLQGASGVADAVRPESVNRVLLLTDGQANQGIAGVPELCQIAQGLREKRVSTTTIGVGEGFSEDLLRGMADAGGGNFHFVQNEEEAPTIFAREFDELLRVAAQNLSLRIACGQGVQFVGCLQDLTVRDGIELRLGDLSEGNARNVLLEFEVAPGVTPGITMLQLAFHEMLGDVKLRELAAPIEVPAAGVERLPVNPIVWREVLLSTAARDMLEARAEADAGNLDKARERLSHTRQALDSSAHKDDPAFKEQSFRLAEMARHLETKAEYERHGRKVMSHGHHALSHGHGHAHGGILEPSVRNRLGTAKNVVFMTTRDVGVDAGMPDPFSDTFEGVPYRELARDTTSPEEQARQWRWLRQRWERIQQVRCQTLKLLNGFARRWSLTALLTTATDGLHTIEAPDLRAVELFGLLCRSRCPEDGKRDHIDHDVTWENGLAIGACGHPVLPDVVWQGGCFAEDAWRASMALLERADAIVVLGRVSDQLEPMVAAAAAKGTLVLSLGPHAKPPCSQAHIGNRLDVALTILAHETSTTLK